MENLNQIISHFKIEGELQGFEPYGSGHINETFASRFMTTMGIKRYVHQRINHHVFLHPIRVMQNIELILDHTRIVLKKKGEDIERGCLELVPTVDNESFCVTKDGNYWRTYKMIEGAQTYDYPENLNQVYESAFAFGKFQEYLAEFPSDKLHETIPDFHNTPKRFKTFQQVVNNDPRNRAKSAENEIKFITNREFYTSKITEQLASGNIPTRISHNDTKLNNVLIDDITGKGICVIDLDTVMPGSALYDFGDMVRSSASISSEDEPDITKVGFSKTHFQQIVHGYLEAAKNIMTPTEIQMLPDAGIIITLEQAIRFLTDYLQGDIYYKIKYPEHNLIRTRTQIKLISDMEQQLNDIRKAISSYL